MANNTRACAKLSAPSFNTGSYITNFPCFKQVVLDSIALNLRMLLYAMGPWPRSCSCCSDTMSWIQAGYFGCWEHKQRRVRSLHEHLAKFRTWPTVQQIATLGPTGIAEIPPPHPPPPSPPTPPPPPVCPRLWLNGRQEAVYGHLADKSARLLLRRLGQRWV